MNYKIFITNSVVSSFIDGGADLALSLFALALVLNSENKLMIAKLTMWVLCISNERTNCLHVCKCLLMNSWHDKAA